MKLSMYISRWLLASLLVPALILIPQISPADGEPVHLLILPFQINSDKDLSYLQNGMIEMLISRLSFKDEVVVIDGRQSSSTPFAGQATGKTDPRIALQAATSANADYVCFGTLTEFGGSISIDGTAIDVSNATPPLVFFTQSPDMDGVIPAVSTFAAEINRKLFGRETYVEETYPDSEKPSEFDTRSNPEKLMKRGVID